jgi:uncharacterized membrane protein
MHFIDRFRALLAPWPAFGLILLMIVGGFLRLYRLDFQSLWLDELSTMAEADPAKSIGGVLRFLRLGYDPHPPLYQVAIHYWFQLWGWSGFTARLLSAFAGVLSIASMYFLGKELYHPRVGFIAAAFTTFNYYNIYYSQEARNYIFCFLFTCVSFIFFIRAIRNPTWKNGIVYSISSSLLLYTHYYSFFIISTQLVTLLVLLISYPQRRLLVRCFSVAFILMTILYLPWMSVAVELASRVTRFWIPRPKSNFFILFFAEYFGKDAITVYLFAFLLLVYFSAGLWMRNEESRKYLFSFVIVVSWIAVSYLMPYIKSLFSVPVLFHRYTIVTLPAILLAAAIGLECLFHPFIKIYTVIVVILLSLVHLFGAMRYYETPTKDQFREVVEFVVKNNPNKFPIVSDRFNHLHYYFRMFKFRPRFVLERTVREQQNVWVITGHHGKPLKKSTEEALQREFKLEKSFTGLNVWAKLYSKH